MAILTKSPGAEVCRAIPRFTDDQSRVLAADFEGVRLVSVYVPNGQSVGSDKYEYKLRWFEALAAWLAEELARSPRLAVMGDFNVAPEDRDVHDPQAWAGHVLFSLPERAALKGIVDLGLAGLPALRPAGARSFTWWDYRMNAFRARWALHRPHPALAALASACRACSIDIAPRNSSGARHAPVVCEIG